MVDQRNMGRFKNARFFYCHNQLGGKILARRTREKKKMTGNCKKKFKF